MGFDRIIDALLSAGGVWAALFLLAALTAAYLYRDKSLVEARCAEAANETAKAVAALHEKRLEEAKAILTTVERNTSSSASRAVALESLNASVLKITEGFSVLAQTQDSRGERCREQVDRIERRLDVILTMLNESERRQEAVLARLPNFSDRGRS